VKAVQRMMCLTAAAFLTWLTTPPRLRWSSVALAKAGSLALRAQYNSRSMPSIRVLHFGLGPIGAAIVKQVAVRPGFKIVGGVDIDPAKIGRDLGDVAGLNKRLGVKVSSDAGKALKSTKPDVVVLCTSSSIKKVMPQIQAILK